MPELRQLRMDRWIACPETTDGTAEIHVFSDASLEGYGAAGYISMVKEEHRRTSLLFARAHVVPIDMVRRVVKDQENHHDSMPRLEVTAARLAATTKDTLLRELKYRLLCCCVEPVFSLLAS